MKIIIPAMFYVEGGIERVMLSLIKEFDSLTDGVVVLLHEKSIDEVKDKLGDTHKVVFESAEWANQSSQMLQIRLLRFIRKIATKANLPALERWLKKQSKHIQTAGRIEFLGKKHQCTHCLYLISNRISFPVGLSLPVATVSHDLFWRFSPLTYSPEFIEEYDKSLLEWLKLSDVVITVSEKTTCDLLSVFPDFKHKLKAIPHASDPPQIHFGENTSCKEKLKSQGYETSTLPTFFFPSSFSLYKDHLTLIRASLELFDSGSPVKIVLTGKDTDLIAKGDFQMSKQKSTLEYQAYIESLRRLHEDFKAIWDTVLFGFGYCDLETVEAVYEICNCIVMPSQYEGFGLAISEAIVRGIPVIAADIEVFREQVEIYQCPDRVFFFQPGNPDALRQCLERFIEKPIPRLNAAEVAERFSQRTWRTVAEEYVETLDSL